MIMTVSLVTRRMADDKKGRDKQAHNAEKRQRQRELREALERGDETEPLWEDESLPKECHRRGCAADPSFIVVERYQEETGQGAVEAVAYLCQTHTREESPANLDQAYPEYQFRIEALP
ncbi:Uncharacterized protein AArcS_2668 [Natranaeroarchaeum sulfidigenes]|uniref:Uncharacterized protein n=2 Tax=Natranaeroarchaeum sulfidigenes TaxID=2784880 RepID=A0A897MTL3_9EURY|nr:Uncharacterized protein AArcS_2668 [Natranaeroarchaeum sulfidigenes]